MGESVQGSSAAMLFERNDALVMKRRGSSPGQFPGTPSPALRVSLYNSSGPRECTRHR